MSALFPAAAAAAPLAAGWSAHTLLWRRRLERARRDPLTGLPTRDAFERRAARLLYSGPRAVFVIDLDGFKGVNDNYGHTAGDAALAAAGRRLTHWATDAGCIVARLGGDEFAAVAPIYSRADLTWELGRLHTALCQPIPFDGLALSVGASIGAVWTGPARHAYGLPVLLRRADEAMYEAKHAGGPWHIATGTTPTHPTVNGRRAGRDGTHTTHPEEGMS